MRLVDADEGSSPAGRMRACPTRPGRSCSSRGPRDKLVLVRNPKLLGRHRTIRRSSTGRAQARRADLPTHRRQHDPSAGAADGEINGYDLVEPQDIATIEGNSDLQILDRPAFNIPYVDQRSMCAIDAVRRSPSGDRLLDSTIQGVVGLVLRVVAARWRRSSCRRRSSATQTTLTKCMRPRIDELTRAGRPRSRSTSGTRPTSRPYMPDPSGTSGSRSQPRESRLPGNSARSAVDPGLPHESPARASCRSSCSAGQSDKRPDNFIRHLLPRPRSSGRP